MGNHRKNHTLERVFSLCRLFFLFINLYKRCSYALRDSLGLVHTVAKRVEKRKKAVEKAYAYGICNFKKSTQTVHTLAYVRIICVVITTNEIFCVFPHKCLCCEEIDAIMILKGGDETMILSDSKRENEGKKIESDFLDKGTEKRNYRQIMYENQLEYFSYDDMVDLTNALNRNFKADDGYEWAYIIHDRDLNDSDELVEPHIHIMFYHRKGIKMADLKAVLQDSKDQHYEFMRSKTAGFLYLTHNTKNAIKAGKTVYHTSEVVANFDYEQYVLSKDKISQSDLDDIILKIGLGQITERDLFEDDTLYQTYLKNSVRINNALETYNRKVDYDIRNGNLDPKIG